MNPTLHPVDWIPILLYLLLLIVLSIRKGGSFENEEQFLLSGRKVTLPALIATLVSTWYGGILGVGEFSYQFGISQWLVLGFPYYLFAALFAIFLAGKIRENRALTIPEAVSHQYGERAGKLSALSVFALVNPAPYILMMGLLLQYMTGLSGSLILFCISVALFSVLYISVGGFGAVLRTDVLQVILMFGGFFMLIAFAMGHFGSPVALWEVVPDSFRNVTGGHNWQYILVWFFIALWTFVDPGFHQRAAAADTPRTARRGIFFSILFWAVFDILTLTAGMYAWAILGPGLEQPALAYPMLATEILPIGWNGLFMVTLLAVIMSTLDSFLFIAGQTLGRDFLAGWFRTADRNLITRISILATAILSILLIIIWPSIIDLWYVIGSVFIPGLLIPVLGIYIPLFRLREGWATFTLITCTLLSSLWMGMGTLLRDGELSYAWLGVEPFYPGLLLALAIWATSLVLSRRNKI